MRRRESFDAALIPEALKFEAAECAKILRPHGWTIRQATEYIAEHVIPFETKPVIAEAVRKYLDEEAARGLATITMAELRHRLLKFSNRFGDQRLHELTLEDFGDWMQELVDDGYEPRGVSHFISKVSSFVGSWAVPRRYCEHNLLVDLRRPTVKWKKPCIFKVDGLKALLEIAPKHGLLQWAVLGCLCGIRPHEIRRLDWSAVHLDDRHIIVDAEKSKTSERRVIELDGAWGDCVTDWLRLCDPDKPLTPWPERRHVEALRAELEARGFAWGHDILRHGAASVHLAYFQDAGKTMKMLGHVGDPRVFDSHYKALLTRADAVNIYALRPS